ncbi:MAG: sugar phosphate isomerase/epimerase [Lachnospiraceae bacterium]|nr:sugar phosphate isomerase/epimerase [Lachnospiraceae bacterium]
MKGRWSIIPDFNNIEEFVALADEYDAAFEYNDFFEPTVYEDKAEMERRIEKYLSLDRDRSKDTLHGVFYDIAVLSRDTVIRQHSRELVKMSMDVASRLGCRGVVFHTGLLAGLNTEGYIGGWISGMCGFLRELAGEYKSLEIYVENTFESYPDIFKALMDRMNGIDNVGLCLDYAHAALTTTSEDVWYEALAPFIRHMHLNDNDLISDLHLAAGDGNIDYVRFKDLMERFDTEGRILLEVNGIDKARRSLEYMTSL